MLDIDKIIEAMNCCAGEGECRDCPYNSNPDTDDYTGCREMHRDAAALLEGYAALVPKIAHLEDGGIIRDPTFGPVHCWKCSECGADYKTAPGEMPNVKYCYQCGDRIVTEADA